MTVKSINPTTNISDVIVHLRALPVETQQEVFAYIDFLRQRQHNQTADFTTVLKKTVQTERLLKTSRRTNKDTQHSQQKNHSTRQDVHNEDTTTANVFQVLERINDNKKTNDNIFDDIEINIDNDFTQTSHDIKKAKDNVSIDLNLPKDLKSQLQSIAARTAAASALTKKQKNKDLRSFQDIKNTQISQKNHVNIPTEQDVVQASSQKIASKNPVNVPHVKKRKVKKRFLTWSAENERPLKDLDAIWQGLVDSATAHTTKFNPRFEVWYQKNQRALELIDQNWAENNGGRQLSPVEHQQIFQQLYEKWGSNWEKQRSNQLSMQAVKNTFYDWRAENEQNLLEYRANMLLTNADHELEIQRLYDELEYTDDVDLSKEILEKIDAKNRFLIWREQYD